MTTLVLWIYMSVSMESHLGGLLHSAEKTPKRLLKNSMCYTVWKSKGQTSISPIKKTIYCHVIVKITEWPLFTLGQFIKHWPEASGPNQHQNTKKKTTITTDTRQNRRLLTSFTKELNLGLPKLLSHTDLWENFVKWPTVQELLLVILVCVICKQQLVLQLAETPIAWPVWNTGIVLS